MPLPQDINPFKMDIQDTLIRASKMPWIPGPTGMSARKILLTLPETGTWVVLFNWKKGFVAGQHKHLSASHTFIIKGKLKVRDGILDEGDYVYEPNGVLHGATEALEDTIYLFICHGPLLGFNENEFTNVSGWEQLERTRQAILAEQEKAKEDA
jgi:anti-sigma factor ChrR (cupin superfamily)